MLSELGSALALLLTSVRDDGSALAGKATESEAEAAIAAILWVDEGRVEE